MFSSKDAVTFIKTRSQKVLDLFKVRMEDKFFIAKTSICMRISSHRRPSALSARPRIHHEITNGNHLNFNPKSSVTILHLYHPIEKHLDERASLKDETFHHRVNVEGCVIRVML